MSDVWKPSVTVAAIIERDGRFDVVSYRMVARRPSDSLWVVHYIRPLGEGRTPRCTVGATRPGYFVDGRCTLRSVAP